MWSTDYNQVIIVYCFIAITIHSLYSWLINKKFPPEESRKSGNELIITIRLGGFLLMALIPLLFWHSEILSKTYIYITKPYLSKTIFIYLAIASLIIATNYKLAHLNSHQIKYPVFQISNNIDFAKNIFLWLIYLLGYEFLFRGVFLFESTKIYGSTIAIILNVLVYTLAHLPKGKFETIGAIPLGIMLCLLTLYLQSFWIVFFIHATIAISNDVFCYNHKNSKIISQIK